MAENIDDLLRQYGNMTKIPPPPEVMARVHQAINKSNEQQGLLALALVANIPLMYGPLLLLLHMDLTIWQLALGYSAISGVYNLLVLLVLLCKQETIMRLREVF